MTIDSSLLHTFVSVHQAGSFTRAAEQLHLTQSAVSHQIRRLEEIVGRPLLHRTTRRLGLTADGEDFLRLAQRILKAQDALAQHFRSSPIEGTVRFGLPERFLSDSLPRLLRQFSRSCPNVRLEVSVGLTQDLPAMLRDRELDLAVLVSPAGAVQGQLLRRVPMVWAAAEDFVWSGTLPLAYSPPPCVSRLIAVDSLNTAGIAWHGAFSSPSLQDMRSVVLSGLAVTAFSQDNLRPGMTTLGVKHGLPSLPELDYTLVLSDSEQEYPSPAVAELGRLVSAFARTP